MKVIKQNIIIYDLIEEQAIIKFIITKWDGINSKVIVKEAEKLLYDNVKYDQMAKAINPYGDGTASKAIIDYLLTI